jgi:hypothetical protein
MDTHPWCKGESPSAAPDSASATARLDRSPNTPRRVRSARGGHLYACPSRRRFQAPGALAEPSQSRAATRGHCSGASHADRQPMRRLLLALSLLAMLTVTAMAAAALHPSATRAGCGGVESAGPTHWRHRYRAPLAIGDSTMLLALPELSREGFSVNAHGCRQYPEALSLLGALRHAHELPRLVVIALGANGEISDSDVQGALQILGHDRLLVLVTPRELGGGEGSDAQLVRLEGRRHPRRVGVLDWVSYSSGHRDWFEGDGLHLTPAGSAALARLIGRVRPLAAPPRSLRLPRCRAPNPVPQSAPSGVTVTPSGGALEVRPRSSRIRVTLINMNPVAVSGFAQLRETLPAGLTIAARCLAVPAGGRVGLDLTLDAAALADLDLRGRYQVRLELTLRGVQGPGRATTASYLLKLSARAA